MKICPKPKPLLDLFILWGGSVLDHNYHGTNPRYNETWKKKQNHVLPPKSVNDVYFPLPGNPPFGTSIGILLWYVVLRFTFFWEHPKRMQALFGADLM